MRVGGITAVYAVDLTSGAATALGAPLGNPDIIAMSVTERGLVFGNGFE